MRLTVIRGWIDFAGRASAVLAAVGWGMSIAGLMVSSQTAFELLNGMGAGDLAYNPMVDYWLRMTAFAFTAIGVQFLVVAIWWRRFSSWAWAGAIFQLIGGIILLTTANKLALTSGNYQADVLFCLSTGLLMLTSLIVGHWIDRLSLAKKDKRSAHMSRE